MREIKFRAWDGDQMIESYEVGISKFFDMCDGEYEDFGATENIMQYTGLKDKNGKEIYEGDIMSFIEIDEDSALGREETFVGTIEYITESGGYRFVEKGGRRRELYLILDFPPVYEVKIIGNIYENPELLNPHTT